MCLPVLVWEHHDSTLCYFHVCIGPHCVVVFGTCLLISRILVHGLQLERDLCCMSPLHSSCPQYFLSHVPLLSRFKCPVASAIGLIQSAVKSFLVLSYFHLAAIVIAADPVLLQKNIIIESFSCWRCLNKCDWKHETYQWFYRKGLFQPVEGHLPLTYLTAHTPHVLWVIIGRVRPEAAGVDPA